MGGCGFCAVGGSTTIFSKDQYVPRCENRSLEVHDFTITSMDSSKRASASSIGTQNPANSLYRYPLPIPESSRPPDKRSRVAACSASNTGLCQGNTVTAVPKRSRLVRAPSQVNRLSVADT